MPVKHKEIKDFIVSREKFIESNREKISAPDEKIRSRWMWGFGTNAQAAAAGYLLLDEKESALVWFNRSAEFYFQCIELYEKTKKYFGLGESFTETSALQVMKSCVLSKNKNNINKISNYIIENKPEITLNSDLIYNYVLALSMSASGDKSLGEQVKKLEASEEKHGNNVLGYYHGTADALVGLLENDSDKLIKGINKILFSFKRRLQEQGDLPLCTDAVMILLTAKNKGFEFDVSGEFNEKYHEYIPVSFF